MTRPVASWTASALIRSAMVVGCVAPLGCGGAPAGSTLNVGCDCVLPDGGIFSAPFVFGTISCITVDEANEQCASLKAQIPPDAGRPLDGCTVNLQSCTCEIGTEPDCGRGD